MWVDKTRILNWEVKLTNTLLTWLNSVASIVFPFIDSMTDFVIVCFLLMNIYTMGVCVYMYVCVCVYFSLSLFLSLSIYIYICVCIYRYINLSLDVCVCLFIYMYVCIYFSIVVYVYLYLYMSSSCRAGSTDIPDPLSPLLRIVHRPRQVFRTTSRILT